MNDEPSLPAPVADLARLSQLMGLHRDRLLEMVRRRIDPALARRLDAEAILSDAYLLAARKWRAFKGEAAAPDYAWFYRITLDCLIEAWRREARACRDYRRTMALPEGTSVQLGLGLVNPGSSPSAALAHDELRERVRRVMSLLKEKDRDILWMRHFDDLSYKEIAGVLRIEENAAHQRYHRALGRLSDFWQQLHPDAESKS